MPPPGPRVGLFVTCLVDLFRPSIGFAAVRLLERAGCRVEAPVQGCCGQPAYNSGDRADAQALARAAIHTFEDFDYVVAPSGSCAAMLKRHYPLLFPLEPGMRARAEALAARCWELTSFLVEVMKLAPPEAGYAGVAAYHDACSGLRELGVAAQPRALLSHVAGLRLAELARPEACCGFGGTFCVKYPEISGRMAGDKAKEVVAAGADTLLGGDLGCLMNLAGTLARGGSPVRVRHVAEVLAGMAEDLPPIGAPKP